MFRHIRKGLHLEVDADDLLGAITPKPGALAQFGEVVMGTLAQFDSSNDKSAIHLET